MAYTPKFLLNLEEEISPIYQAIDREFQEIARELRMRDMTILKEWNAEPDKPRDGMVVLADGTNWDPGSGQGYYGYYGAAWHKLG